jgi:hypothetical protein
MKNTVIPVSNDTNSQNTPLNSLEQSMNEVNKIIQDMLPEENQIFLKEKEEIQKNLLLKIEEEIKKISQSVNYDYGYFYDYENILCADD